MPKFTMPELEPQWVQLVDYGLVVVLKRTDPYMVATPVRQGQPYGYERRTGPRFLVVWGKGTQARARLEFHHHHGRGNIHDFIRRLEKRWANRPEMPLHQVRGLLAMEGGL